MDIQKKIARYLRNHAAGGSVRNVKHFIKLVKQAEQEDRDIIIHIDSPGTCGIYRTNFNDIQVVKSNIKPTFMKYEKS